MNMLSRNLPIALVVGAAGFIGSHLIEKLLEKGIQVVGVDDLSSGTLTNLNKASSDKHFHFLNQSFKTGINLDFPRLDYAVFCISDDISPFEYSSNLKSFLDFCVNEKFSPKIMLISSINLYSSTGKNPCLLQAEKLVASFAVDKKINARVVRLAEVYGPRMHFKGIDPVNTLIQASIKNNLQEYSTALDFSSRSIFILDVVDLLAKALLHGGTAHKIFDGALLHPIKVGEIKQVLIDPLWHESRNFKATELPPWPTPNLLRTQKELSWKPKVDLIESLKQTVRYFKDGGVIRGEKVVFNSYTAPIDEPKVEESDIKDSTSKEEVTKDIEDKNIPPKLDISPITKSVKKYAGGVIGAALIFYALILPLTTLVSDLIIVKNSLSDAARFTTESNFNKAQDKLDQAKLASNDFYQTWDSFLLIKVLKQFRVGDIDLGLTFLDQGVQGSQLALDGVRSLSQSLKLLSGEESGEVKDVLGVSTTSFLQSSTNFTLLASSLKQLGFNSFLAKFIDPWEEKIDFYQKTVTKLQVISQMLPTLIDGKDKKYLFVLEDNSKLKPGGGVVNGIVGVEFSEGHYKQVKSYKLSSLEGKGSVITPPTEIKNDLKLTSWSLKEAATDVDFSVTGTNLISLYRNQTGDQVSGVFALDLTGLQLILKNLNGVVLADGQTITDQNLIPNLQNSPDPDGLTASILESLVNKLLFVGSANTLGLLTTLDTVLTQKHLQVFFIDSAQNFRLETLGYLNAFPKYNKDSSLRVIAPVETNLLETPVNFSIKRSLDYQINLDPQLESYKLITSYTNSDSNLSYKFRYKIYLPNGTKINKAFWEGTDLTTQIGSVSDYNQSGFSLVLELLPKEQKTLTLEFSRENALKMDKPFGYNFKFFKQPGTFEDSLNIKVNYPDVWLLTSGQDNLSDLFNSNKEVISKFELR